MVNTISVGCRDRIGDCGARTEGKELQRGNVVSSDGKPREKKAVYIGWRCSCAEKKEELRVMASVGKVGGKN